MHTFHPKKEKKKKCIQLLSDSTHKKESTRKQHQQTELTSTFERVHLVQHNEKETIFFLSPLISSQT